MRYTAPVNPDMVGLRIVQRPEQTRFLPVTNSPVPVPAL